MEIYEMCIAIELITDSENIGLLSFRSLTMVSSYRHCAIGLYVAMLLMKIVMEDSVSRLCFQQSSTILMLSFSGFLSFVFMQASQLKYSFCSNLFVRSPFTLSAFLNSVIHY
jgi:hypothetical protein